MHDRNNPLGILFTSHGLTTHKAAKKLGVSYWALRGILTGTQQKIPSNILMALVTSGMTSWDEAGEIASTYQAWRQSVAS